MIRSVWYGQTASECGLIGGIGGKIFVAFSLSVKRLTVIWSLVDLKKNQRAKDNLKFVFRCLMVIKED